MCSAMTGPVRLLARMLETFGAILGSPRTVLRASSDVPAKVDEAVERVNVLMRSFLGAYPAQKQLFGALTQCSFFDSEVPPSCDHILCTVGGSSSIDDGRSPFLAIVSTSIARLTRGRPAMAAVTCSGSFPGLMLDQMQSPPPVEEAAESYYSQSMGGLLDLFSSLATALPSAACDRLCSESLGVARIVSDLLDGPPREFSRACWFLHGATEVLYRSGGLNEAPFIEAICRTLCESPSPAMLRAGAAALSSLAHTSEARELIVTLSQEATVAALVNQMSQGSPASIAACCAALASVCTLHSNHHVVRRHRGLDSLGGLLSFKSPFTGEEVVSAAAEVVFVIACDTENVDLMAKLGGARAACTTLESGLVTFRCELCPLYPFLTPV